MTISHRFYVNQFGWTRAAQLRAGDVLVLSNGEYVVVEFIQHEILESPVKVYNFEVKDFHTYFVGENSVLVHNGCEDEIANVNSNNREYDPSKPLSPSNYPPTDLDMSMSPVKYEPTSIEEVQRMRAGKGPTTRATHGDRNIEAHHRHRKLISNGGVFDELEEYAHRRGGNHKRHTEKSELTAAQRRKEIAEHWKKRGAEYFSPGEGI